MDTRNTKMENADGLPHIRLNKFILRCPICQKGFSRRTDLYNHKICRNLCSTKDTNNNVVEQNVMQKDSKFIKFSCSFCGENFYRWSVFCRHTSFHTYFSAMKEASGIQSSRNKHRSFDKNLEKQKPGNQTMPPGMVKIKTERNLLSQHTRSRNLVLKAKNFSVVKRKTYSERKPAIYKCKFCHRKFRRGSELIVHLRVHTNQRPYKCKFCSKRFKQLCHVTNHERLHNGEEPWQCTLCGRKFRQKSNFNYHVNKKH